MELSRVLCDSSPDPSSTASPSSLVHGQEPSLPESKPKIALPTFSVLPDRERKRLHRLSEAQKRQHQHAEPYESRVRNLTFDINNLRQQIQQLVQLRTALVTRLLVNGQRFEGDMLQLTWTLLDGLRDGTFGLSASARSVFPSRTHISQHDPGASDGVHQFIMQRGRPTFKRPAFSVISIRKSGLRHGR
ncbi:hypothetical protein GN244_ATG10906 [Phytophthora infestans]|uniref:Uncharacterized protein n=1 Tax=Phytophthora infestans TaxID=4787 RepID=A0A833WTV2_PHYIN|nr:hypothetical protein GN244_ATG10906 [Phytophthora infestans]KAF4131580.1 hypothetical protein GN958_ATG19224 [Phytophthora infestans]KAF4142579.1 hypothetical protein GN958_ATG08239 [Phytophthora infestans]